VVIVVIVVIVARAHLQEHKHTKSAKS